MSSYLQKLFLHQVPLWHIPLALIFVHFFIYLYYSWFRQSIIAMVAFTLIPYFLYKLIRPSNAIAACELMTEDACKSLYASLYVNLNKLT